MLIGLIAAEWSSVESMLAQFCAFVIFGLREVSKQDLGEYIALDVMERTTSFQGKVVNLLRALEFRFGLDDPHYVEFGKRLKALERVQKERNYVVHGRWALSDKHPKSLIWRGRVSHAEMEVYHESDFEAVLQKILKAEGNVSMYFGSKFQPRLQGPLKNRLGYTITME
jgi:hypothetical protein